MCASAAAPGRGTEKGGYRGHLMGCPVSVVRRERRISQPWLKPAAAVEGNNIPAPTKGAYPLSYRKLSHIKPSRKKPLRSRATVFLATVFSSNCFGAPCTLSRFLGRCGGVRSCLFLLVLPSIQTVLSAPDFHRFGLSCGRASLAESWRPVRMRRFVRFLPACESGSRAVTAGSEFHRPRSTMSILIMPQRTPGV